MEMVDKINFKPSSLGKRLKSMLKVDFRRMFTMPLFYVIIGICFIIPILILVMTTAMDGTVRVDPNTGIATTIEAFDNTWQIIGSISSENSSINMSLTGMCNINILYFLMAVLICIFIAGDFRRGYSKNLFAVRSKKNDYVISKTLIGFIVGICMLISFFVGAVLGGFISGLPFDSGTAGTSGIVMCLLSKMFLTAVFAPIYVLMSVIGKQKLWLSLLASLCVGMLFFNIVPMMTPLNSSTLNVILCLAGGVLFSIGIGTISNKVLSKTSLV